MSDREIELKLICEPAELERVRRAPVLLRLKQGRASGKHLHSIYFDTDDLALGQNGMALRLRRKGKNFVQTLKTEADKTGAGSVARDIGEYEAQLPGDASAPDLNKLPEELRGRIRKLANGHAIAPRLVSDIRRTVQNIATPEGDLIELALDRGALQAGGQDAPVSEIELELKQGSPASLYRVALDLNEIAELRIGHKSKSERGFALLHGLAPGAVKAEAVLIDGHATLADAYEIVLRHCLVHLMANEEAAAERRSPEGLHQMRVALRRARSAFEIFKPVIGGDLAGHLAAEAKWLANELGAARDLDVFTSDILEPVDLDPERAAGLQKRVADARDEAWARALDVLHSRRYTRFLLEYGLFLTEKNWHVKRKAPAFARDFAGAALDKRLAKAAKLGREIDGLEDDERHELRKRLKKLRYALHFFSSLYDPEEVKPYLKYLSQMQDVFGGLNDLATAHDILARLSDGKEMRETASRILAWHEKRAEKDWKGAIRLWKRFAGTAPFWREKTA
ncbi:CHAD domain-containing protein [Parvibaculum sp.]|uniref:CYTH and CHAD domain-containing protein n=1 Tax=Parvibaculum sp. TaxID=2024848 RepID=UPI0039191CDF